MIYSRKCPRLEGYDYSRENVVFATVCVRNRRNLLGEIHAPETEGEAPKMELSPAGKIVEKYTATIPGIDKYVIMPNHVHLIVFNQDGASISQKIRSWKILISKEIGESIWQRSFYDHVIRDEQDYLIRWKYIDDNPAKWASDEYYQK